MKNSQKIKLVGIKQDLARLPRFKNRCYVCHAQTHKRGMTFHHLSYLPGEMTYSDFPNSLEYYQYLSYKIKENPKRFLYVCNIHHQSIERVKRFSPLNRNRLIKAVRMTQ
jgi:hypothetical protein